MTRYKLLKSSISLEDFEDLLAFLVAGFDFDKNQAKPWSGDCQSFISRSCKGHKKSWLYAY